MKAVIVIGTRPQIIKTAPLLAEAEKNREFQLDVIHTGQHYDYEMSKIFFNELDMPEPIKNLGVGSASHSVQTAKMLIELEKIYNEVAPDIVLVPGDTNSTLAGALAAVKMHIPVAHIESGARSFDMNMPEEANRRMTDHCSSLLFTVSENCKQQLIKENIPDSNIALVGDTMYESIVNHMDDIDSDKIHTEKKIGQDYFVLTAHRAENVDNKKRLRNIIYTILTQDDIVIFPCHPRTRNRLQQDGLLDKIINSKNIRLLDPVSYFSMLKLIKDAKIVLTDSGGIQKEAFWLDTPCVTLRDNTEWVETISQGMNVLAGADPQLIESSIKRYLNEKPVKIENPYDQGGASSKIIDTIQSKFG